MGRFELGYSGEYSLARAVAFLEGWPPSGGGFGESGRLRWAACMEGTWLPVAISVTQEGGRLLGTFEGDAATEEAAAAAARVLSVDVDASTFAEVGRRDPIVGSLQAAAPGLRPVCFWTPYEAAVWAVLSQRISMKQASVFKQRITATGPSVGALRAFPPPEQLASMDALQGVNTIKMARLHAVAGAALAGDLDATRLRSMETGDALELLRRIPGVGPFSADLILVRGAGHPDVFAGNEPRLHAVMRSLYGLPEATPEELAEIAEAWRPYRSWVGFLLRTSGGGAAGTGAPKDS